jgi:hypothetical protein
MNAVIVACSFADALADAVGHDGSNRRYGENARMRNVTCSDSRRTITLLRYAMSILVTAAGLLAIGVSVPAYAQPIPLVGLVLRCDGTLAVKGLTIGGTVQPDLLVDKPCRVEGTQPYYFGHVNIVKGGSLIFVEPPTEPKTVTGQDFWATSIIIENGGALLAGVDDQKPYGKNGKTLTIHLYGADPRGNDPTKPEGPGESCVPIQDANFADCGIPIGVWNDNGTTLQTMPAAPGVTPPQDYFYQYGNFHGDEKTSPITGQAGHFGYKVLALSYGGTLRLHGLKGTSGTSGADITTALKSIDSLTQADEASITNSGTDWTRLQGVEGAKLTLTHAVQDDWKPDDEIVVTSTDYLPEHSEVAKIASVDGATVTLNKPLEFTHNTTEYDVGANIGASTFRTAIEATDGGKSPMLGKAETRAAVALLTRSIRIVSEGDTARETFDQATARDPHYMYGGQTVARQGFQQLQIQGVEFKQLGQGGLLGRYPVHFHEARRVPADTYVIDSSVNESMTRWFVIHSTLGVTLARNVGWKSIGHGYFLEDATETDNKLYSNIGIFARGSVNDGANPRKIPGLLDARNGPELIPLKFHSDSQYPSIFWITNGWNAFAGNMGASAGTCGACYWLMPAGNHDMMDVPDSGSPMMTPMKWSGYSALQADPKGPGYSGRAGLSPVRLFYKNYCSTAMHSLSVTDGSPCLQVRNGPTTAVPNLRTPDATSDPDHEPDLSRMYYPRYAATRKPTVCNPDAQAGAPDSCSIAECTFGSPKSCYPSVFSYYTSSFNWAESNFSAIWLRSSYLLLDHAFLSDVQGPGITMVTGGDYSRSNLPVGYWGLTTNSVMVGETQPKNPFAQAKGPTSACTYDGNLCLDKAAGVGYPLSNFGAGQRLMNVYDGPAYQDADAFLDIHPSLCNTLADCMYYQTPGVRKAGTGIPGVPNGQGYLPNAAIGWKQPNGFYYPPAFHSRNLFFGGVDIRHYVVEPITFPGTYRTDPLTVAKEYAFGANDNYFRNYSDIDRQTELSDDDGSLTGFDKTVSVNEDSFFAAPVQTAECRSAVGVNASNACSNGPRPPNTPTARTSPYEHITTVLAPDPKSIDDSWSIACNNENCTGVPVYRTFLTGVRGADAAGSTREWARWMKNQCDGQLQALRDKTRTVPGQDPYGPPYKPPTTGPFEKFAEECPSPFVRFAGMTLYQRSALTVNNGRYFIDTTVSQKFQDGTFDLPKLPPDPPPPPPPQPPIKNKRNVSVFKEGKSYYVFFLFATPDTKQTYQIYVGKNFNEKAMVSGVRVEVERMPLESNEIHDLPNSPFLTVARDTGDGSNPDVVNVNIDFTNEAFKTAYPKIFDPENLTADQSYMDETCQPHTYCTKVAGAGKTTCGCDEKKLGVLGLLSPFYKNVCKNICEHWAVKDLDCPKGGCFGFKFTMPPGFEAKDQMERPRPAVYPSGPADPWGKIQFVGTSTKPDAPTSKGDCSYPPDQTPSNLPGAKCPAAD